jgi:hypothetical protein
MLAIAEMVAILWWLCGYSFGVKPTSLTGDFGNALIELHQAGRLCQR